MMSGHGIEVSGLAGNLHVKRHCYEIVEPKFGSQGNALHTLAAGMCMRRREAHHFGSLFACFSLFF